MAKRPPRLTAILVLRHLAEMPGRALLTLLGIAIGVSVLVAVRDTNTAIITSIESLSDRLSEGADLVVRGGEPGIPRTLVDDVNGLSGVDAAAPLITQTVVDPKNGDRLMILGVDFIGSDPFRVFKKKMVEGEGMPDPLEFANDPQGLLLPASLAQRLSKKVGDHFKLITPSGPRDFHLRGILDLPDFDTLFGGAVGIMSIDVAAQVFSRKDRVDRIDVAVKSGQSVQAVVDEAAEVLGGRAVVEGKAQQVGHLKSLTAAMLSGLTLAATAALLVGLFVVYQTMSFSVVLRRREVAVWRALGATRRRVIFILLLEAVLLSGTGALLGVPLGHGLAQLALDSVTSSISSVYVDIKPILPPLRILPSLLWVLLAVTTAVVAALRPAWKGSTTPPALAFVHAKAGGQGAAEIPQWKLAIIGSLLMAVVIPLTAVQEDRGIPLLGYLALMAVLIGANLWAPLVVTTVVRMAGPVFGWAFGIFGKMATHALLRDLGRAAGTASAFMYGLALYIGISTMVVSFEASVESWLEHSVPADISITIGSRLADMRNVAYRPEFVEALNADDDVEGVMHVRLAPIPYRGIQMMLLSMETETYFQRANPLIIEGESPIDAGRMATEKRTIISESLQRRAGLSVGDALVLTTPKGEVSFQVSHVVRDFTSDQGYAFIDRRFYLEAYDDSLVDSMDLFAKAGVDRDALAQRLSKSLGQKHGVLVTTRNERADQVRGVVRSAFGVTRALELIALLVALLGIINTLTAQILARTREMGLLRAVGASRHQVAMGVVMEALCLGLVAIFLGTAAGLGFGAIFTTVVMSGQTSWTIPMVFPWGTLAEGVVLAMATALVAGLLPARRVVRLNVLRALEYE
jgi:putative ABC transport system permease protein